jgi:hypothetical protein
MLYLERPYPKFKNNNFTRAKKDHEISSWRTLAAAPSSPCVALEWSGRDVIGYRTEEDSKTKRNYTSLTVRTLSIV